MLSMIGKICIHSYAMFLLVCYVSILKVNGKDTLDFSKQLATYVEVNITYDG